MTKKQLPPTNGLAKMWASQNTTSTFALLLCCSYEGEGTLLNKKFYLEL